MNEYDICSNYLMEALSGVEIKGHKFVIKEQKCKKEYFEKLFDIKIDCHDYDTAVSGEGSEFKKIDTICSSALQSLLIFAGISKENPIVFELKGKRIKFIKAYFEYKNRVIHRPSSVDVVLVSEQKDLLFIESKLLEPIKDSEKEGKPVVGISYFYKNEENGYQKSLQLTKENLDELAIDYPPQYGTKEKPETQKYKINPLAEGKYVYSEGIRQTLSHIIGIKNIDDPDDNCSRELSHINPRSKHFITIVNNLPDYPTKYESYAEQKLKDFKKHVDSVVDLLEDKVSGFVTLHKVISYQELYEVNHEFFDTKSIVTEFYRLNK